MTEGHKHEITHSCILWPSNVSQVQQVEQSGGLGVPSSNLGAPTNELLCHANFSHLASRAIAVPEQNGIKIPERRRVPESCPNRSPAPFPPSREDVMSLGMSMKAVATPSSVTASSLGA